MYRMYLLYQILLRSEGPKHNQVHRSGYSIADKLNEGGHKRLVLEQKSVEWYLVWRFALRD